MKQATADGGCPTARSVPDKVLRSIRPRGTLTATRPLDDTWAEVALVVDATTGAQIDVDCELSRELLDPNIGLHDYGYSSVGEAVGSGWFEDEIETFRTWDRVLTDVEAAALCHDLPSPE